MQDLHALRLSSFMVASVRASTDIDCIVLPDIHIVSMLVLLIIELYNYIHASVRTGTWAHTHTLEAVKRTSSDPLSVCISAGAVSLTLAIIIDEEPLVSRPPRSLDPGPG